MILRTINDPASLERQRKLLTWLEAEASRVATLAGGELLHGHSAAGFALSMQVTHYRALAERVRERLVDVAEQALCDLDDEPPGTLVALTDWLVARLGRHFPYAPITFWQGVGALLLPFRRAS